MLKTWSCVAALTIISLLTLAAAVSVGAAEREERKTMAHQWTVEAAYPQFDDQKVDEAIREWLNAHIAEIIGSVKDYADVSEKESSFTVGIDYEVSYPSDSVVSVLFDTYTYPSGAAHPSTAREAKNILFSEARFLGLDDLFATPEKALEILSRHARPGVDAFLHDQRPSLFEDGDAPDLFDGEWFAEGSSPKRENYSCLSLVPEGVKVHFQQYQVVPYAFGMPEYVVTLEELAPAGPSALVWPRTTKPLPAGGGATEK